MDSDVLVVGGKSTRLMAESRDKERPVFSAHVIGYTPLHRLFFIGRGHAAVEYITCSVLGRNLLSPFGGPIVILL